MSKRSIAHGKKTTKTSISAALSLAALMAIVFGLSQCKLPERNNSQVESSTDKTTTSLTDVNTSFSSSYVSNSTDSIKSNDVSSDASSIEVLNPEEPAEVKNRDYSLNNLEVGHIRTLFNRIFTEAPLISDLGFEYVSDTIIKRYSMPSQRLHVTFELNINGKLNYVDGDNATSIELDFAQILTDYLKKEDAVLIGKNYKNNFAIVKNNNKWYFQFLGLNLPFETSIPDIALISVAKHITIEGVLFEKYAPGTSIDNRKNVLPLLFYKHFADVLIENKLIDSATTLFNKAEADALKGQFDTSILRSDVSIESGISTLSNSDNYIVGEATSSSYSMLKCDNYCLASMFQEANKDFTSNENIYLADGELKIDNKSNYEGVYTLGIGQQDNFFPFANAFELTAGQFDGIKYANNEGKLTYTDELGKYASVGMRNYVEADYYTDDKSIDINIDNYIYSWTLTDAYYYILDFYTQNAYFKSAKLLYANNYNANLRSE